MNRMVGRRFSLGLLVALVLALPASTAAQSRNVRFEGRVLWISGTVLSVGVNDGPSVGIDLARVPQSDYIGLAQGDWVIVVGELSADRRRILGLEISRVDGATQAP